MYTRDELNDIYERFAQAIDISEELFKKTVNEYRAMSNWIDEETPYYTVHIYPQGSFALGTVVKPLTDEDEYDLDLVCEFADDYELSAKQLKVDILKPFLLRYKKTTTDIVEKRRCWCVEYDHFKGFHMDVIPAYKLPQYVNITDKDEEQNTYEYIGSNPQEYINWFRSRMAVHRQKILLEKRFDDIRSQAEIDDITEFTIKTPLQKAIQILKRHRDMMFSNDDSNCTPISIIITTIMAQVYNNEDNIFDTLSEFFSKAKIYIDSNFKDGQYHIDNPSYTGEDKENFADKWNEHPERAEAFFKWLKKATIDLLGEPLKANDRIKLSENMNIALGKNTTRRVFSRMAEEEKNAIVKQVVKIVPATGIISKEGSVDIPKHHHYGK
jgi:hypothetical protein